MSGAGTDRFRYPLDLGPVMFSSLRMKGRRDPHDDPLRSHRRGHLHRGADAGHVAARALLDVAVL